VDGGNIARWFWGSDEMTIKYADGRTVRGVILSRSEKILRAALKGEGGDAVTFTSLNGTWFTEDREPVQIEFAWQRRSRSEVVAEADCICSKELASRLIHLLLNGTDQDELAMPSSPDHKNPATASNLRLLWARKPPGFNRYVRMSFVKRLTVGRE
jgi:hypothetical protein